MDSHGRTSAAPEVESNGSSIFGVLKDIGRSIQGIVRSEIKLAKMEVAENAFRLRSSAVMLGSGAILGLFAIGFILLGALFALEIVLPAWLAALILGALLSIGAGIGIAQGRQRLRTVRGPEKTIQTVKEDFHWMKEQARL